MSASPLNPAPQTGQKRKKRPRQSIKLDRVDPRDFMRFDLIYSCDQCSHYDATKRHCSMGYKPQHTKEEQLALYSLTGFMAFCRFLEID